MMEPFDAIHAMEKESAMNLVKDLGNGALQVLKTVAPGIADTAAGPRAPLVDPIFKEIFGTNDPKQVELSLLTATPEQLRALRQADNEHAEKLTQLGIDCDRMAEPPVSSIEVFAMALKRRQILGRIWVIAFLTGFLLVVVYQHSFSRSLRQIVGLSALIAFLTGFVGAVLAATTWSPRCPLCKKHVLRGIGKHCPECGSALKKREHRLELQTCSPCGLEWRGDTSNRTLKVRYCLHCGCRLHEKGFSHSPGN
jgi:hypothetical protein